MVFKKKRVPTPYSGTSLKSSTMHWIIKNMCPSQETQRDSTMIAMQNLWKADFAKFTATLGEKLDEYEKSLEFTAGKLHGEIEE
ncbi:hypothetical protein M8J77_010710 [Diaphorina citri]|nr:hypothetical protein M8J77_010710 [Diaphorina citri]